jgi:flavin reductase (DIM6/NTAB) family NADH-FMN oxidoreductase RutF
MKQTEQKSEFYIIEDDKLLKSYFKSSVVPRPIAWVSTISAAGVHNIAPFSYFSILADSPCMVMISATGYHSEGGHKDTIQNILDQKEFVVNMVTYELFNKMLITSHSVSKNIDEFEYANLDWIKSANGIRRVAASPIQLECEFYQCVNLPCADSNLSNTMVIGKVKKMYIDRNILDEEKKIDYSKMKLVARMNYDNYLKVAADNFFVRERS